MDPDADPMLMVDPNGPPIIFYTSGRGSRQGQVGSGCNCPDDQMNHSDEGIQGRIEIGLHDENLTVNLFEPPSPSQVVDQPIVLITICVLLLLYLIGLIICRVYDLRDERKHLGLTIMADLADSQTSALYLITVVTGCNFWAGTTSCVSMIITGSEGKSQVIALKDWTALVLRRGGVDTYLISCDKHLGDLEKIRMWTDYTGYDPKWYCRKIFIRCVNSNVQWYFYINKWLTVTHRAPSLIVEVPATHAPERKRFSVRFKENVFNQFDNVNLWTSIFRYSPASTFTRCQRLSCCIGMLTAFTLANICILGVRGEYKKPQNLDFPYRLLEIGRYTLDLDELMISILIVFATAPIGFLLVFLFKNITPRVVPTLLIWENVIPAKTMLRRNSIYIPLKEDADEFRQSILRRIRVPEGQHELLYTHHEGDHDDHIHSESSSDFNIPSTDVPKLEGWIRDRSSIQNSQHQRRLSQQVTYKTDPNGHRRASLTNDAEHAVGEAYAAGLFTNSVDIGDVKQENRNTNDLVRLGRHSMIHAIKEVSPDAFIFRGSNNIEDLEKLIDTQIQNGGAVTNKVDHVNETQAAPWKKLVTAELIDDVDQYLEEEAENKHFSHGSDGSWTSHKVVELCLLPPMSQSCTEFPWWWIVIAWGACLSVITFCCYASIVLGVNYGYEKSKSWLETFINDFFVSVLISQPLKSILVAFLFTALGKHQIVDERIQVIVDRGDKSGDFRKARESYKFTIFQPNHICQPVKGNRVFRLLIEARRKEELRIKFLKLILCILLMIPLIAVSYAGHNEHNYQVTRDIRNLLHLDDVGEGRINFDDRDDVLRYLKDVIDDLHPRKDMDGKNNYEGWIDDGQTLLIGVGRFRQQRVHRSKCDFAEDTKLKRDCNEEFSSSTQDRRDFIRDWKEPPENHGFSERFADGWRFHKYGSTNKEISVTCKGYKGWYDGGGYILDLGRTRETSKAVLEEIKTSKWIDSRTRAIFVEFTLLNPSINKFVDVVLLIEQGPTRSYSLISWISPIELIPIDDLGISKEEINWVSFSLLVITITLACHIFLLCHDVKISKPRSRLFRTFGFWMDILIVIFTIVSICMSFLRFLAAKEFGDKINHNEKLEEYVSIQRTAYWNEVQRAMYSLTQTLVFIKFWNLLMFTDRRFLTYALTLQLTTRYMVGFLVLISVSLSGFALAGHFMFGNHLSEFSTWGDSIITLIDQILGVSIFDEVEDVDPITGRIYSYLFGFFVVFIGLNFVIALLDLGVHEAKDVVSQRRVWLTYRRYLFLILVQAFPIIDFQRKRMKELAIETAPLAPVRIQEMRTDTITFLRTFLNNAKSQRLQEMQKHCNRMMQGTKFRMVKKTGKKTQEEDEKKHHSEVLRQRTTALIKKKLGHDMTPEEFNDYAEFNRQIVNIRVRKLERKLQELEDTLQNHGRLRQ